MRLTMLTVFLVMVSLVGSAFADVALSPDRQIMSRFEIQRSNKNFETIAATFELVHADKNTAEVLVPARSSLELLKLDPSARLIAADDLFQGTDFNTVVRMGGLIAGYRSIDEVYSYMRELAGRHPGIVKLIEIGKSARGRSQYALKISDNVDQDEPETELMITSATHGDELITVEMLLGVIDDLVKGYPKNSRYQAMIDEKELFFIPVVSPDGFANQSRYANGTDPNRNFPWPEREQVSSIKCIDNLRNFFEERDFAGAIDYHAYGEMIMYPWAYTRDRPTVADQRRFDSVGNSMSEHNGYRVGQISRIIYVAKGSSADYWYWKNGTIALGIEIANSKVPSVSSIPRIINDNRESTYRFIESF